MTLGNSKFVLYIFFCLHIMVEIFKINNEFWCFNSLHFHPDPVVVVFVEELLLVCKEPFTTSGVLNFPLSKPSADKIIKTTIAINIKPIKHISNLSV